MWFVVVVIGYDNYFECSLQATIGERESEHTHEHRQTQHTQSYKQASESAQPTHSHPRVSYRW